MVSMAFVIVFWLVLSGMLFLFHTDASSLTCTCSFLSFTISLKKVYITVFYLYIATVLLTTGHIFWKFLSRSQHFLFNFFITF